MRPADGHMHTALCKHATGTPEQFRQGAVTAGVPAITFTDHAPDPSGYDAGGRMSMAQFPEYRQAVLDLQDGRMPAVRFGIEADYYPGAERFLSDWLPRQEFDVILGSVHYLGDWGFDNPDNLHRWKSVDLKGVWKTYFDLIVKMTDQPWLDVISHFDLPKKFGHRLRDRDLRDLVQPVLDRVMETRLAIEINTAGWRKEVAEAYPSPLILELMHERGIPICFGADAHEPEHVGYRFDDAVRLAREAGYAESVSHRQRQLERIPLPVGIDRNEDRLNL
jgi:histidinol-phosphatase (PHP family)